MSDNLKANYTFHRQQGRPSARALELARADLAANVRRYPRFTGSGIGTAGDDGLQWVERPEAIGLRFVGFADEIAGRSVSHTGWYTDEHGLNGQVLRGAVYQYPARNGCPFYVAGYREGENSRKRGWSDSSGENGGTCLLLRALIIGGMGGRESNDDGVRDAARLADEHARVSAEHAREYESAWQAGRRFADYGEEIAESRRQFLELRREIKSAGRPANETPTICATLRRKCESLLSDIRNAREEREKLRSGYYSRDLRSAFNEGAEEIVFV